MFTAGAHTIPGGVTLSERVLVSDVVVVATIQRPTPPDAAIAEAKVVEVVRGDPAPGPLRFEPHSHSGEGYTEGESVVLFLRMVDRAEPSARGALYRTVDDISDRVSLGTPGIERPSRASVLAAVRAYARGLSAPGDAARAAQRKEATLTLLAVPDIKLQTSALRDVAQGSVGLDTQDTPRLLSIADDPAGNMAFRVALLQELDRRRLVDPVPRYVAWLTSARLAEMGPLATAAGRKKDPAITAALVERLVGSDEDVAVIAARGLGEPLHDDAITELSRAADPVRPKLAAAAIESLGRIGTKAAELALSDVLKKSDDPEWKRKVITQQSRIVMHLQAPPGAPSSPAIASGRGAIEAPARVEGERRRAWPWWTALLGLALATVIAVGVWSRWRR